MRVATLATGVAIVGWVLVLAAHKDITLVVGGQTQDLRTTTSNVQELLEAEGIPLGTGLQIAPSPATALVDGMTVVVSPPPGVPAEALQTMVDTEGVGVWVVERTDEGTQGKASLESVEATASALAVGRSPVAAVRVVVSGKVHDVLTNASTAGALLSAMGIQPDADDRVVPPPSTPLHDGDRVRFDNVQLVVASDSLKIPFGVTTRYTTQLAPGASSVATEGTPGIKERTVLLTFINGVLMTEEVLLAEVARQPVDEVRLAGPQPSTGGVATEPGSGARAQSGQATWYDPPWSGMTAAHPFLPFGTRVTVIDVASGRSVTVVIDDRGPFAPGRIIDLSPEAFQQLAPLGRGVLDVRIAW